MKISKKFAIRAAWIAIISALSYIGARLIPDGQHIGFVATLVALQLLFIYWIFTEPYFGSKRFFQLEPARLFAAFFFVLFVLPYLAAVFTPKSLEENRFVGVLFLEHVNRAVFASFIGLLAFYLGNKPFHSTHNPKSNFDTTLRLSATTTRQSITITFLTYLSAIFFYLFAIIFSASGGLASIFGAYTGLGLGNNTADGLYFLTIHFALQTVCSLCVHHLIRGKTNGKMILLSIGPVLWALLVLASGDRNSSLLIMLPAVVYYAIRTNRSRTGLILLGIPMALVLYQAVEIYRSDSERSITATLYQLIEGDRNEGSFISNSSFSITTVALRATFSGNNDGDGIYKGKFKLIGAMGLLPYSRSLFFDPSKEYVTSSDYLSDVVLGTPRTWSVGSNVLSDSILDFGITFVPLALFLLGSLARKSREIFQHSPGAFSGVLFLLLCTYYFQWPRYTLDFPIRSIGWFIFLYIFAFASTARFNRRLGNPLI